ncbi:hypothetical protein [Kribbella flavida]|uniref:hypothetical protein n=1 Tax=Kribbella flavida TaxID=182640 RepID=UPI0011D29D27|nr:hypothetical protein [Kribbella flavida]
MVIGVALATTAAALLVPVLVRHDDSAQPAGQQEADSPWRDRLSLELPRDLAVHGSRGFTRTSQGLVLEGGSKRTTCVLRSHAAGSFDPSTIPASSPTLDINGARAYRAELANVTDPSRPAPTIVWEPTAGSWTTSHCGVRDAADPAKAEELARKVQRSPQRLAAPYKIGYLPAGFTVGGLSLTPSTNPARRTRGSFQAYIGDGNNARSSIVVDPASKFELRDVDLRIDFTVQPLGAGLRPTGAVKGLTVNGRTAYWMQQGLLIQGDGFTVMLDNWGRLPQAELLKIANGLELTATPTSPANWFDAAQAIP